MFIYLGSDQFRKAQPSGLNWVLAHSPLPIIGELASWREASSAIEKDRAATITEGLKYTSFRSVCTRIGEMTIDRMLGYLIVPVVYPQSIDIIASIAKTVVNYVQ